MEYHVLSLEISPEAVKNLIDQVDPSAVVDMRADGTVRISTYLDACDVHKLLGSLMPNLPLSALDVQPSMCCGSCSG